MRFPVTLTVVALAANIATAGIIPPIPRLPASALKPPEAPDQPAEDSAKLADRITQNTKEAGDRLAQDDTSAATRKTQEQILKDIDALLKQSQNPPPPMGGGSSQNNPNNNQSGQGGSRSPMGGSSRGGGQGGGRKQPSGGGSWRERRNSNAGGAAQQANKPQPMPQANNTGQPMPQANAGNPANPGAGGSQNKATPDLPLDEAITKQVWGHLPERLRQQMSQYYRERFMPKYGDLLRQYYASLAEREKAAKQP